MSVIAQDDDADWSIRGDYWQEKAVHHPNARRRAQKIEPVALVLNGYGIRIAVDRGALVIHNGFTHYPQQPEEYRFFPGHSNLPSRIVILDSKGAITFDALRWLSEQNIPLLQLNWRGEVLNIGGGRGYSADYRLVDVQRQLLTRSHGFEFAKWLLERKIENCIATLRQLFDPVPFITLEMLEKRAIAIKDSNPVAITTLLGLEGVSANLYFRSWYSLPLKWKGIKKQPIPSEWHSIGSRYGNYGTSNQLAHHPLNAILNYAYGMLENQVRIQILVRGYDPTIGYIHANNPGRIALVFDLMEPLRPLVDAKILGFIRRNVFNPADFILDKNGVCRLHPQFARKIVKLVGELHGAIEDLTAKSLSELLYLGLNNTEALT